MSVKIGNIDLYCVENRNQSKIISKMQSENIKPGSPNENEIIEHLSEEDINALENSLSTSTNENDAIENYLSE